MLTPRPWHSNHPDFIEWLLTTSVIDLQIRASQMEDQLADFEDDSYGYAILYASVQHTTLELNIRANRVMNRRRASHRRFRVSSG